MNFPRSQVILFSVLLAAALAGVYFLYAPTRPMGFMLDDNVTILKNNKIHGPSWWAVIEDHPFRAIPNLTFAVQVRLNTVRLPEAARRLSSVRSYISETYFPKDKMRHTVLVNPTNGQALPVILDLNRDRVFALPPAGPFRRFNLVVHALNAALVFMILLRLRPSEKMLTALAACLFLIHPLATESVNYITARYGLLAFTFSAAAVLFHLRSDEKPRRELIALICFILALLCKETAAALPVLVFFLDLARGRPQARVLLGLILSGAYFLLRLKWPILLGPHPQEVLSPLKYLLVEQRVFWLYAAKIFLPQHQNFDYDLHPRPGLDLAALGVNAVLMAGAAFLLVRHYRRSSSRSGTWAAAILAMSWTALAPVSTLIPLADLVREERTYPLLALVLPALVFGLSRLWAGGKHKKVAPVPIFLIIVGMCLLTHHRNRIWTTEYTVNRDVVSKSPRKARAVTALATSILYRGDIPKALFWYELAARLDPADPEIQEQIRIFKPVVESMKAGSGKQ